MEDTLYYQQLANPDAVRNSFENFVQSWNKREKQLSIAKTIGKVVRYDSAVVTGQQIVEYFVGTASTPANRSNLGDFIPPESEHQIVRQLRIYQATGGAGDLSKYNWGVITDVDVRNARFTVSSNGVTMLKDLPVTDVLQDQTGKWYAAVDLPNPHLWEGQTEYKLSMKFITVPAAADLAVRVETIGLGSLA